jgi:thiamine-phosphate pyrophosphorylase
MHYYIISQPFCFPEEKSIINFLLHHFEVTFHLRKPDFTQKEMADFLNGIDSTLHKKIVLHSHHRLSKSYNIKGIHFTHHNKQHRNEYISYTGTKSISTHSLEEIKSYNYPFDYYFLSPVFPSTSKPGYGGNQFNFPLLKQFISEHPKKKIVALSGINTNTIKQVKQLGFYGAAILGDFWNHCQHKDYTKSIPAFFDSLNSHLQ